MHHIDFAWLAIKIASREWCACDVRQVGSNPIRIDNRGVNEDLSWCRISNANTQAACGQSCSWSICSGTSERFCQVLTMPLVPAVQRIDKRNKPDKHQTEDVLRS